MLEFASAFLILTGSGSAVVHRDLIITLAARHKLPAVYFQRLFVAGGGLISYGADFIDDSGLKCFGAIDPTSELAIAMQQSPERPVRDHLIVWSRHRK